MTGDGFVAAVIALQSAASFAYLWRGDWKQCLVWSGVAISNLAYLSLSRS